MEERLAKSKRYRRVDHRAELLAQALALAVRRVVKAASDKMPQVIEREPRRISGIEALRLWNETCYHPYLTNIPVEVDLPPVAGDLRKQ
jgi:hypothetical protein